MRLRPVLVAAALSAAALVAAPVSAGAAPAADAPAVVTVTPDDNGKKLSIQPGDFVDVDLPSTSSGSVAWVWSKPVSSDATVLAPLMTITEQTSNVIFRAVGKGTAKLSAYQGCRPATGYACPAVVIPWTVTVDVG